MVYLILEYNKV